MDGSLTAAISYTGASHIFTSDNCQELSLLVYCRNRYW